MPGFFDSLFDDDEPTGFFGGYRPRGVPASANADLLLPISDKTPDPSAAAPPGASNVLTYPDGTPVIDINTDQPYTTGSWAPKQPE